jgi:hypothetical protein
MKIRKLKTVLLSSAARNEISARGRGVFVALEKPCAKNALT